MRLTLFALLAIATAAAAAADTDTSSWKISRDKKLGVAVRVPAQAKVTSRADGLTIAGPDFPTVTITISATDERGTTKDGGRNGLHVAWTINVPERAAQCTADAADEGAAYVASAICESIDLTPGPRHPHVALAVTSSGLDDGAAYEKAVRARQAALDACWKKALAADKAMPEGAITFTRDFDHGAPAGTRTAAEDFFDHDAKALGACVTAVVKAVAAKSTAEAAHVEIKMICQLY
jgi:hypothetical protein